jgi:hypothetical protein
MNGWTEAGSKDRLKSKCLFIYLQKRTSTGTTEVRGGKALSPQPDVGDSTLRFNYIYHTVVQDVHTLRSRASPQGPVLHYQLSHHPIHTSVHANHMLFLHYSFLWISLSYRA